MLNALLKIFDEGLSPRQLELEMSVPQGRVWRVRGSGGAHVPIESSVFHLAG